MKKMLTPTDLQTKIVPLKVSGNYNWEKQAYQYDNCKWGTSLFTSNQTCSGQWNHVDDFPSDSISD